MTSSYKNYLLDRSKDSNVLKKDYTLDYTDYEKLKINEQYNRLYSNVYTENKRNVQVNDNEKIYNLSLSVLLNKAGIVYIALLNELAIYFSKENEEKSINKLGLILTKDERLLYIGLLFLILSFSLWMISITS